MKDKIVHLLRKVGIAPILIGIKRELSFLFSKHRWKALENNNKVWIELGAGTKRGSNGWTTVDLGGADIAHDLRRGIPMPDNSVDRIYSSHLLEHIPFRQLPNFINECYRVLKQGGEMSVCVPNARLYIKAYLEGREFCEQHKLYEAAVVRTSSMLDQVNYIAYMDGQHNYMFDEENLVNTLRTSPFKSVALRAFEEGLDMKVRDFESIYALAVK